MKRGGAVSITTRSAIEVLAESIEAWGDGWRFLWNPDDHGRRARIVRNQDDDIRIEIEIHDEQGTYYVFAGCSVRCKDGHWENVSVALRNPTIRKTLDHINHVLDQLETMT